MKKTLLLFLMALLPMLVSAYDAEIGGIYYNFSGNEAIVTYRDANYNSYSGDVVLPPSVTYNGIEYAVTTIGAYTFNKCNDLTSVTIPNSVTSIRIYAFLECRSITSVYISDLAAWCNIKFGNTNANPLTSNARLYVNGEEIKDFVIPNSITSIGDYVFAGCNGMTSVTIPESVTSIGNGAFQACLGLTSMTIPNSVTSIGSDAFSGCSGLTSVTIPENVTSIGNSAFSGCSSLTSITIPNNVTSIGMDAFADCSSLTSVYISDMAAWCNISFSDSRSNPLCFAHHLYMNGEEIKDLFIPNSVISIGNNAFSGYSSLTSVTIPESVISIGNNAFSGCSSLTSVTIPESVTSIGNNAFSGCTSLTSITIPNGVTSIRERAFSGCSSLTSVIIPNVVTSFGYEAFYGCTSLTFITIPNSVTSIGGRAFRGCSSLTSITIPNGVTKISDSTFSGCYSLTSVTIPSSVTSIDSQAFGGCCFVSDYFINNSTLTSTNNWGATLCDAETSDGILIKDNSVVKCRPWATTVTIPNSVTSIRSGAFANCTSLTSVTIPERVTSIGGAFAGCSSLTSVNIPESVTDISSAFQNCTSLSSITIPNGVRIIDDAFSGCSSLTSITIPNSVTSIGIRTFYRCSSLTYINIPNSVTSIGGNAFNGCSSLTTITIPNSVTSIYSEAFDGTAWYDKQPDGLVYAGKVAYKYKGTMPEGTHIVLEDGTLGIAEYAFSGCTGLTSITIPNSVTSIVRNAFWYRSSLTSVISKIISPFRFGSDAFSYISSNCVLTVPLGTRDAYIAAGWTTSVFKGGIVEKDFGETIAVGSSGYATFCSPYALDFSEVSDIKAYIASGFNPATGTLVLTRVTEVPSGEGLYIVGTPGEYEVPKTTTSMFYSNLLKGVTEATNISPTEGNMTNFILANGIHGVAFYTLSATGDLAAGKAYLQLPTTSVSNVKAISIDFDDDDATAIHDIEGCIKAENIYNMQGQKVNQPKQGLYIVNGKKVLFK